PPRRRPGACRSGCAGHAPAGGARPPEAGRPGPGRSRRRRTRLPGSDRGVAGRRAQARSGWRTWTTSRQCRATHLFSPRDGPEPGFSGADVACIRGMNAEASTLRVVIVLPLPLSIEPDDREQAGVERARVLRIALLEAGYNVVAALPGDAFLPERIGQIQPDLIVVDAESQGRDILEHVVMATRDERRPIVMFSDDEDTA